MNSDARTPERGSAFTRDVSRRAVLKPALAAGALWAFPPSIAPAVAAPRKPAPTPPPAASGSALAQLESLPLLSDALTMDQESSYASLQAGRGPSRHTVQSADVDGDGQDELLVRGSGGLIGYTFDAASGQWFNLAGGIPEMSDAEGWDAREYYATIQTGRVVEGAPAAVVARTANGLAAWQYRPPYLEDAGGWTQLPYGPSWPSSTWSDPSYYSTIQCADVDGDGVDEVLGRGPDGLEVWKFDGSAWQQLPTLTGLDDANGYIYPDYYSTIQCAVLQADSPQASVLVRSAKGIEIWRLSGGTWAVRPGPPLSDDDGWDQAQYYSTIQTAHLTSASVPDIIARGYTGLQLWTQSGSGWTRSSMILTDLSDANGWDLPEYYLTLQCADVDGDGLDEVLARAADGMVLWRWAGGWQAMPAGPPLSDTASWDQVQYYSTIQTAVVDGTAAGQPGYNSNNVQPGVKPASVLVARAAGGVRTYRYAPQAWTLTSAPWPVIDDATLYALSEAGDFGGRSPRALYTDTGITWDDKVTYLAGQRDTPPTSYTGSLATWQAGVDQLVLEFGWVASLQSFFLSDGDGNVKAVYSGVQSAVDDIVAQVTKGLTLTSEPVGLHILAMIASIAGAILAAIATDGLALPVLAAVAGVTASVASFPELVNQGDEVLTATADKLAGSLRDVYGDLAAAVGTVAANITGGDVSDGTLDGDYGMLQAVGRQVAEGASGWVILPNDSQTAQVAAQRALAVYCWQRLGLAAPLGRYHGEATAEMNKWDNMVSEGWYWDDGTLRDTGCSFHWLGIKGQLRAAKVLESYAYEDLFDPAVQSTWSPLGVDPTTAILGRDGWGVLTDFGSTPGLRCPSTTAVYPEATNSAPSGPELHVSAMLEPRRQGGDVVLDVEIANHGLTAATNVEITSAALRGREPDRQLPSRHLHIKPGFTETLRLRYPAKALRPGKRSLLRLRGTHDDQRFTVRTWVTLT